MSFDYRAAYNNAKAAFEELRKRREKNDQEIARMNKDNVSIDREMTVLKQSMDIFAPFVKEQPIPMPAWFTQPPAFSMGSLSLADMMAVGSVDSNELGMTQAIRAIMRKAVAEGRNSLSVAEVRDKLVESKFDVKGYTNVMATIHTILGRIASVVETPEGKRYSLKKKVLLHRKHSARRTALKQ